MKRASGLWEKMCSLDTAIEAIHRGTENKRAEAEVIRRYGYMDKRPEHLSQLDPQKVAADALRLINKYEKGWMPAPLRHKHVAPPGQKERDLGIPTLDDHILGWMMLLAIEKVIMRGMYKYCCGSVPDRGIDYARRAVQRWVQCDKSTKYFVKLDIRHFYQNINTELLKSKFSKVIKDRRMLEVIAKHIDMGTVIVDKNGDRLEDCCGIPVGTYPAPWFSNFYLQDLDHYVVQQLYKERRGKRTNLVKHYLRYVDDMLLLGSSRRDLEKAVRSIIQYCRNDDLEIKACWEIREIGELVHVDDGSVKLRHGTCPVDIVGYRFYRDQTTIRGGIFLHTSRLATKMAKNLDNGYVLLQDAQALVSLIGWFSMADSVYFMREYIDDRLDIDFVKEVISYAAKSGILTKTARIYCGKRQRDGRYYILRRHN